MGKGNLFHLNMLFWVWNAKAKVIDVDIWDISKAIFQKHVYGRKRKYNLTEIIDYDTRPPHLKERINWSI